MKEGARRNLMLSLGAIFISLLIATPAQAARDPLDATFGESGVVVTPEANGVVTGLVEDSRRRIVAAGVSGTGFVLARYLPNGSLDGSFEGGPHSTSGVVRTELNGGGGAFGLAVQRDGKVVAAGSSGLGWESSGDVLIRYLADGRLDRGFGAGGLVQTRLGHLAGTGLALALQKDGRILVGGSVGPMQIPGLQRPNQSGLLIRYLPDGSIDRGFGTNGQLRIRASGGRSVAITAIAVLPSGKIVAGGNYGGRLLVIRLLPDGRFDPSFGGGDGRSVTRIGGRTLCDGCPVTGGLAFTRNGRILFAGSTDGRSALVAYLPNGAIDRDFGDQGIAGLKEMSYFGAARDVLVTRDGRIVVAGGTEYGPRVLRFLPDGRVDRSFADAGVYSHSFRNFSQACAVLEQPGGGLVIGGRADAPPVSIEAEDDLFDAQFLLFRLRP